MLRLRLLFERPRDAVDGEDIACSAVAATAVHAADEVHLCGVDVEMVEVGEG
jgi:hypothetical protein